MASISSKVIRPVWSASKCLKSTNQLRVSAPGSSFTIASLSCSENRSTAASSAATTPAMARCSFLSSACTAAAPLRRSACSVSFHAGSWSCPSMRVEPPRDAAVPFGWLLTRGCGMREGGDGGTVRVTDESRPSRAPPRAPRPVPCRAPPGAAPRAAPGRGAGGAHAAPPHAACTSAAAASLSSSHHC